MQNRALVENAVGGSRRSRIVVLPELLMMMMMGRGLWRRGRWLLMRRMWM